MGPELDTLEALFRRVNAEHLARTFPPGSPNHERRLEFALGRFREGRRAAEYLTRRYPEVLDPARLGRPPRVLDLGCGNGGMLLPFAAAPAGARTGVPTGVPTGVRAWGLDLEPRPEVGAMARAVARAGGRRTGAGRLAVRAVAGRGEELPFPDAAFDLVLFAETVEHLDRPRVTGREIVRVLRPGGLCYVTTPPRLRFLVGRDPHYDLPGLLLLPDRLQRWLFERVLRPGERYGVRHTFWSVAGVLRTLPGLELVEVTSKNWAGPLRRLDWDWIVARKVVVPPGCTPSPRPSPRRGEGGDVGGLSARRGEGGDVGGSQPAGERVAIRGESSPSEGRGSVQST